MKTAIKILLLFVVLGVVAWGGYYYFQTDTKIAYITETVKKGTIRQTVSATGEIFASQLVDVGAQASGQIKKMHVVIGQTVKKGDLIAEIDSTGQINTLNTTRARLQTYEAQAASAEVAVKSAKKKFERYRALRDEDAVSKEEFENAEDALAAAKARVSELTSLIRQTRIAINTAETDLGYTRIVAPMNGTVVALVVEEGQTVNAVNTTPTIVQIANLDTMLNKMQIAEGDVTKVKAGQPLSFTILSEPDNPINGVLESVDPGLTTMSQGAYSKSTDVSANAVYYYARATVDNPEHKLAIGMTTQNTIEVAAAENVLIVPTLTVKQKNGKSMVRVLSADDQVEEKEVTIGMRDAMNVEIQSGLHEGEQVILSEAGGEEAGRDAEMRRRGRI